MPSPPTSSTSNKVDQLYRAKSRRVGLRSSLIATFKKAPPEETNNAKAYEVASKTLSTEATAKVFRHNQSQKHQRGRGPDKHNRPEARSPARKLVNRYPGLRDDGTGDFSRQSNRRQGKAAEMKQRRDEVKEAWEENERRGRKGRLSVSRDDTLLGRGANPRTGVVSPFVMRSDDSGYSSDNTGIRSRAELFKLQKGSWKYDDDGWNLVEPETSASPTHSSPASEDRLLVDKRRADAPLQPTMSLEQIRNYQRGVEQAMRKAGPGCGFEDPFTVRTPTEISPEGSGTPPRFFLQKIIKRKKVGSGAGRREPSTDTVIVKHERASSMASPRKGVQIVTPKHSAEDPVSSIKANRSSDTWPFLGHAHSQHWKPLSSRPATSGKVRTRINTPIQEPIRPGPANAFPSGSSVQFSAPPPVQQTPTLSQQLPPFPLRHPSHFTRLPTTNWRLVPPHPRPSPCTRAATAAPTTTATTTITTAACAAARAAARTAQTQNPNRPHPERQACTTRIPQPTTQNPPLPTHRASIHGAATTPRPPCPSQSLKQTPSLAPQRAKRGPTSTIPMPHIIHHPPNETYIGWVTASSEMRLIETFPPPRSAHRPPDPALRTASCAQPPIHTHPATRTPAPRTPWPMAGSTRTIEPRCRPAGDSLALVRQPDPCPRLRREGSLARRVGEIQALWGAARGDVRLGDVGGRVGGVLLRGVLRAVLDMVLCVLGVCAGRGGLRALVEGGGARFDAEPGAEADADAVAKAWREAVVAGGCAVVLLMCGFVVVRVLVALWAIGRVVVGPVGWVVRAFKWCVVG